MAEKKEEAPFHGILSGLLGGGLFLGTLVVTSAIIPAIFVGLGGFVAGLFLFQPPKTLKVNVSGVTQEMLDEALVLGKEQAHQIKNLSAVIAQPKVREEAFDIARKFEAILEDIRKDPKDLKTARSFLNYYPDAVIKILQRYTDLQSRTLNDQGIQSSLQKAEGMLKTIRSAFEKQLAQLLQDDVMDLDTELELLRRTMQSEGLGD